MHALTNQVDVVIIISLEYVVINFVQIIVPTLTSKHYTKLRIRFLDRNVAQREGFEPTRDFRQMVLETITFDHSDTVAFIELEKVKRIYIDLCSNY